MIKLEVPEAFAIDYLSILDVKWSKDNENSLKQKQYWNCFYQLEDVLGKNILSLVTRSLEYNSLFSANLIMYDAVEKARYGKEGEINPKEWDKLNMDRHRAKQELQKKFWGNELSETKT